MSAAEQPRDVLTPRIIAMLEADGAVSARSDPSDAASELSDMLDQKQQEHLDAARRIWQQALLRQTELQSDKDRLMTENERLRKTLGARSRQTDPCSSDDDDFASVASASTFTTLASISSDVRRAGAIGAGLRGTLATTLHEHATSERMVGTCP